MPKEEQKQSAEKDLLKIIEGKESALEGHAKGSVAEISMSKLSANQPKRKSSGGAAGAIQDLFSGANINRFLMGVLAVTLAYLFISVFAEYSRIKSAHDIIPEVPEENILTGELQETDEASPEGEIAFEPGGSSVKPLIRNLFSPGVIQTADEETEDAPKTAVGHLRLVGISLADNPSDSYAMVENTRTDITFFLKKGETLEGLRVKDVKENLILFDQGGDEVELR